MRQLGKLKKFFAGVLAAAMVLTSGVGVMAAEATDTNANKVTGSITIDNAIKDTEKNTYKYDVYRVFDFYGSTADTSGEYDYSSGVYKLNSEWNGFTSAYFSVNNADGVITFGNGENGTKKFDTEDAAKAFAAEALKYAKEHNVKANYTKANAQATPNKVEEGKPVTETLVFSGLPLGYYLVDSSVGAALSIDTNRKDATIHEKNEVPTVKKEVLDEDTNIWGKTNDSAIGKRVDFQVKINAKKGAQNYILHDKMTEGLTFGEVTSVSVNGANLTAGTDYEVKKDVAHENNVTDSFDLEFKQSYLDTITADTTIVVSYYATVNEKAKIASANLNEVDLEYGDGNRTQKDSTETYVYSFDLKKFAAGKEYLAGAKFTLLKADKKTPVKLVAVSENGYRVAKDDETNTVTEFVTNDKGMINFAGLDAGQYYLKELEAPAGYNLPSSEFSVNITRKNQTADGNWLVNEKDDHKVDIENLTGSVLPSTGGIGTTIFYLVGGLLIIGAFVAFIVRRKMAD